MTLVITPFNLMNYSPLHEQANSDDSEIFESIRSNYNKNTQNRSLQIAFGLQRIENRPKQLAPTKRKVKQFKNSKI